MILKKCAKLSSHAKYKRRQSKVILNNSEGTNGITAKLYHLEKFHKEIKHDALNSFPDNSAWE